MPVTAEQPLLFDLPEVPKRQKSKWEELQEMAELHQSEQGLIPPMIAAVVLDLSKQRISQLMQEKVLRTYEFFGRPYVSVREVREFIDLQRDTGRPWHSPSAKELWKRSRSSMKK